MEYTSGIKIRDIFLDNGNWWKLFLKKHHLIRFAIIFNVLKMLSCRTPIMGYHVYSCLTCNHSIKVPHSCKSRFCPSCGKKGTDKWLKNKFESLPNTRWQHITFTMPSELWPFFWVNRSLMGKAPALAAKIMKKLSKDKGFLPGIYLAIHTFGRKLNRNYHIHLSTTTGGLSLENMNSWISSAYFFHNSIKRMWRYEIINLFREEFKKGNLKMPPNLRHLKNYTQFNTWISKHYSKKWVVYLNKQSDNHKHNIEYLGKYLKRPPIGETRIKFFDKKKVTYEFLDHYTKTKKLMELPVHEFIERLISHIHDKNFRCIRYYGFLSNRLVGKLKPIVNKLLNNSNFVFSNITTSWRDMIKSTFNYDPLECKFCKNIMQLTYIRYPSSTPLFNRHQEIANGNIQLI